MEQGRDSFAIPHFRDYWFIMLKRKKTIIISVILPVLIGLLGTQKETPIYKAQAKIMLETGEELYTSEGKTAGIYASEGGNLLRWQSKYEEMRSSSVAKKTAEMLGWEGEDAVKYILGSVEIKPVLSGYEVTNVAYIVAGDPDPQKAMDIANYTVKSYIAIKEAEIRDKIRKTYDIYSQQMRELKDKIRDAEIAVDEYKRKHNIDGIESEIEKKKTELSDLLNVYTEKHPLVIQKRAQIDELNNSLKGDLKGDAEDPLGSVDSEIGKARSEYYTLEQEIGSNKELYNFLISNVKQLNVSEEMGRVGEMKVLEWAVLPSVPEKKNSIVLFFAPFIGLFLGIGLVFFLEYMDNTIKTEADIKQYVGLTTIGVIQHIDEES